MQGLFVSPEQGQSARIQRSSDRINKKKNSTKAFVGWVFFLLYYSKNRLKRVRSLDCFFNVTHHKRHHTLAEPAKAFCRQAAVLPSGSPGMIRPPLGPVTGHPTGLQERQSAEQLLFTTTLFYFSPTLPSTSCFFFIFFASLLDN